MGGSMGYVTAYRMYNVNVHKYGEPFGMCNPHFKKWNKPNFVILEKLGEKSPLPCNECSTPSNTGI